MYNKEVENSFVPPEVLAQAAAGDQKDDQADDQTQTATPAPSGLPLDPQAASSSNANASNALAGQDAIGGGEGSSSSSQTLTLKEQLKMLSPLGLLHAMLGLGPSQEQQQADEQRAAQRQQQVLMEQQRYQQFEQERQQRTEALRSEIEDIKAQGHQYRHTPQGSVLFQRTTDTPSITERDLATRALKDAARAQAQHQQQGAAVPKGKQTGPVDFGTLAKQKSGMQKASEMPMGE